MEALQMEVLYLSQKDVKGLGISMKEVLKAVDQGFCLKGLGRTEMPPKRGIHTRPDAFIHAMPAYVEGIDTAGLKWVGGYPKNTGMGLPYITGLLVLNDPETGIPLAIMDCAWITAMRTGASTGISAKYLATQGSHRVGILGCGVQARTSLMALVETLPDLSTVKCYDLYPEATKRFIAEMNQLFPELHIKGYESPKEMIEEADVIVSAIPIVAKPKPPLDAGMMKMGGLAISLDYDAAWTSSAMKECNKFISDDVDQLLFTRKEGTYFSGIPENIYADLGEVVAGVKPGREDPKERIFSMNMGIAVDDMVTAKRVYERALEQKAGIRLPL